MMINNIVHFPRRMFFYSVVVRLTFRFGRSKQYKLLLDQTMSAVEMITCKHKPILFRILFFHYINRSSYRAVNELELN